MFAIKEFHFHLDTGEYVKTLLNIFGSAGGEHVKTLLNIFGSAMSEFSITS